MAVILLPDRPLWPRNYASAPARSCSRLIALNAGLVPVEQDVDAERLRCVHRAADGVVVGVLGLDLQSDPDGKCHVTSWFDLDPSARYARSMPRALPRKHARWERLSLIHISEPTRLGMS